MAKKAFFFCSSFILLSRINYFYWLSILSRRVRSVHARVCTFAMRMYRNTQIGIIAFFSFSCKKKNKRKKCTPITPLYARPMLLFSPFPYNNIWLNSRKKHKHTKIRREKTQPKRNEEDIKLFQFVLILRWFFASSLTLVASFLFVFTFRFNSFLFLFHSFFLLFECFIR